jgi:integrase
MADQAIIPQRRQRRRTLTDRMVAALPRRSQPYFHPDPELPKHGVRIRPNGPGAFTVITRDPYGKQKWAKLGSAAEMTISEAREVARTVIKRIEAGLEPFPAPKPKAESVAAVAANWLHRHVEKSGLRTAGERRRIVEKYILPHWRDRVFIDIRRKDVAALLDHVEDQHGPAIADQVLATLRSMATWVQQRDDNYVPPFVRGMRRTPIQDRKRARILSDDELRRVWHAAGACGDYGAVIKLLLFTAQRRQKILTMRWSGIGKDGTWTIPTEPREKGNPGVLQLPPAALAVLKGIPRFVNNDHIFAGNSGRQRTFNLVWLKAGFDRACGVRGWRLHDLRRTARSLMSRAGVVTEHAERVLGHARPAMEKTYDVHAYDAEKAAALAKLAALIDIIVNPPADNVVTLHDAAVVS